MRSDRSPGIQWMYSLGLCISLLLALPAVAANPLDKIQHWSGTYSDQHEPLTVVADMPQTWDKLWSLVGAGAPPSFDAKNQIGVGIFLGRRPTGGYGVRVTSMGVRDGKYVIEIDEDRPDGGAVTQALSYPYLILRIDRPGLPVSVEPRFRVQ